MENEEMDVFARALLFLYKTALEEIGVAADLRVVRRNPADEK